MKVAITIGTRKQQGYVLLSIMLLMTLMLIALSIELPRIRQQIRREKEDELQHRAHEYTGAIKRYYRKFGRYPASFDDLEKANNIRFLRKRYKDPMTGKDDWRIIHPGESILKVGSNPGSNQNGQLTTGSNNSSPFSNSLGSSNSGSQSSTGSTGSSSGSNSGSSGSSSSSSSDSGSAFNNQLGGGGVAGVASKSKEESIKIINEKNHYNEWEFTYDPRFEAQTGLQGPPGGGTTGGGIGGGIGNGTGGSIGGGTGTAGGNGGGTGGNTGGAGGGAGGCRPGTVCQ